MSDPDTEYPAIADRFGRVVAGVQDWEAPAPVAGWVARDVVHHLTTWMPGFLSAGGVQIPTGDREDPVGSWRAQDSAVRTLLADRGDEAFDHPYVGSGPLSGIVSRFYTADVFMHTWDLARASGQDDRLDADRCEQMLAGMQGIEEMLRTSGQYGPAHPVAAEADATDRLVAFIGRDPQWRPA